MPKVLIMGGSGMLGAMLVDVMARDEEIELIATVRDEGYAAHCSKEISNVTWKIFDADTPDLENALDVVKGMDYVINAIGITKPMIRDDIPSEVCRAIRINSLFPYQLSQRSKENGAKVIQIATDCVYSGTRGNYVEDDKHDPQDGYGMTKSLGEIHSEGFHNLRCSIIGPEPKDFKFLVEWFLGQPKGSRVFGFVNHRWNGLTTLHFARICLGIIKNEIPLPNILHLIPTGELTKAEMLHLFAEAFSQEEIDITDVPADYEINRVLQTNNEALNYRLWQGAGYEVPPSVPEMINEMSRYNLRLSNVSTKQGLDLGREFGDSKWNETNLSILVPCLNEEENVENILEELDDLRKKNVLTNLEVLVLDDSSTDDTFNRSKKCGEAGICAPNHLASDTELYQPPGT